MLFEYCKGQIMSVLLLSVGGNDVSDVTS